MTTPDFRVLWNKPLLVGYLSAIYPADKPKFKRWTVKQLKAVIIKVCKQEPQQRHIWG
jgi:hypothetical protein